jgi:hypothetical protein
MVRSAPLAARASVGADAPATTPAPLPAWMKTGAMVASAAGAALSIYGTVAHRSDFVYAGIATAGAGLGVGGMIDSPAGDLSWRFLAGTAMVLGGTVMLAKDHLPR